MDACGRCVCVCMYLGSAPALYASPKSHTPLSQISAGLGPPEIALSFAFPRSALTLGSSSQGPGLARVFEHMLCMYQACAWHGGAPGRKGPAFCLQVRFLSPSSGGEREWGGGGLEANSPVPLGPPQGRPSHLSSRVPYLRAPSPSLGRTGPGGLQGCARGWGGGSPLRGSANGKGGRAGCVEGGEGGAAGARRAGGGREAGAGARGARAALTLPRPGRAAGAA